MSSRVPVRAEIRRSLGMAVKTAVDAILRPARRRPHRRGQSYRIEPMEARQYLTTVTLTGPGVAGTVFSAYLNTSTSNVDFYLNGSPGNGTPIQSVAASSLASVAIVDTQPGATDRLNVYASGSSFTVNGSATSDLTLDVEQGSVTLSATQTIDNVEVGAGGSLNLAGNVTLNSLTVDGSATHTSGTLTASVLNVDNAYTDAGGVTASGLTLNNTGTFTATYAGSLAGTTGTFNDGGNFVENVPAGGTNTIGMSFNNDNMRFDLLSGTLSIPQNFDTYASLTLVGTNGTLAIPYYSAIAGSVTQSGGTFTLSNALVISNHYANGASYTMTGGTMNAGTFYVGCYGTGSFTQSAGTINVSSNTTIGMITTGATFTQTGGTDSLADFWVGAYGGSAIYNFSGGTVSAGSLKVGGDAVGVMNLSGTASLTVTGWEFLAFSDTSVPGRGGDGRIYQTGGTNNAYYSQIDAGSIGYGLYDLSGGSFTTEVDYIGLGGGDSRLSHGTFIQTGGTHTNTSAVFVGTYSDTVGTMEVDGGTFTTPLLSIGNAGGVGAYDQSGGDVEVGGSYFLANDGTATGTMSGGTFSVSGNAYVGYNASGALAVSGGTVNVAGNLYVTGDGNDGDNPAGAGTFTLSGTNTRLNAANIFVGYSGPATFNLNGGTAATGYFVVDGPSNSIGTLNSNGGTLNDTQLIDVLKPTAGGASVVDEGSLYTLNLSATTNVGKNAITAWNIAWGDSTANTSLSGNPPPSSAPHTFETGGQTYTINATASGG